MPGIVGDVCNFSYGYVDPYVEKARNAVPLIDKAAQRIENYIPPVIETADKYVDPAIKYVEPKVDMIKGAVEPYYERGVGKVGEIRGEVKKNYTRGVDKVEEIYSHGVDKVEDIKSSTRAFVTPTIDKIRTALTQRSEEIQKIMRVPASQNLQDLKAAKSTVLGRAYAVSVGIIGKLEGIIDHWLPAPPSDTQSTGSEDSTSSDSPLFPRLASLPCTMVTRLTYMVMQNMQFLVTMAQELKKDFQAGTLREKLLQAIKKFRQRVAAVVPDPHKKLKEGRAVVVDKYKQLITSPSCTKLQDKLKSKLGPMLLSLQKAPLFQKSIAAAGMAVGFAVAGCIKVFGQERTKAALSKLEQRVPASWKFWGPSLVKVTKVA